VTHTDRRRRLLFAWCMALASVALCLLGLVSGSQGWSLDAALRDLTEPDAGLLIGQIRAPRTLAAWMTGALLGTAGAVAQGVFRNPLADPFLLGSAAGASLAVVLVLAAGMLGGQGDSLVMTGMLSRVGLAAAAFAGALGGVLLTLMLARGAQHTLRLLLCGVVVGVVLSAVGDLVTQAAPDALRGRQVFMLGTTAFLGWDSLALLLAGVLAIVPLAMRLSRVLDALALGDDTATSLGLAVPRLRLVMVALLAAATGLAVSQAGLVAFVGLVSPHLVRRMAPAPHGFTVAASAATGGTLLLAADVLARAVIAPQELPVGVITSVLGGGYLLWLMHKRRFQ
jgi:iron complex transport system permease protein